MTQHYVVGSLTLKQFLCLVALIFAGSATLLSILLTSAATATGSQPSLAISLVEGSNTGILGAHQQRWFRILPSSPSAATSLEKTLTLSFAPPAANLDQLLTMALFEGKAAPSSRDDDLSTLTSRGEAELIVEEGGKRAMLIWHGQISAGKTYYIHLANPTDFPLDYRLLAQQPATSLMAAPVQTKEPAPAPTETPATGAAPDEAVLLGSGLNQGKLKAGSQQWYTFKVTNWDNPARFYTLKFTLFFTPDDGQRRHYVNFQLFTAEAVARWRRGEADRLTNFGAGMLLARDGDPNTGERLWQGTVMDGQTYFLLIENGTAVEIDYWLFDDDVEHPEF